jgi:hypothetical protein
MNSHRIDIEPISLGQRGHLYRVHHAGAVLILSSRNPEFDACRLLLTKGIVGRLEVWHLGAQFPSLLIDIVKGSGLTVEDSDRVGPRLALWRPQSENATNAVSGSSVGSRTASNGLPVGSRWPLKKDLPGSRSPKANIQSEFAKAAAGKA